MNIPKVSAPATPSEIALAEEVIGIVRSEQARRIAAGETNHIDEENFLLPRWCGLAATGAAVAVLVEAVGYLSGSRVSCSPTNPKFSHEKTPNYDRAQAILRKIGETRAGEVHAQVCKIIGDRVEGAPLPKCFIPGYSSFSAYWWRSHGDWYFAFQDCSGFRPYAVVLADLAEQYLARFPRVLSSGPGV